MAKYYKKWFPLFVLPLFLCFAFFVLLPFFMGIFFSFTEYKTIADFHWTGWENYVAAFSSGSSFWHAFGMTVAFVVVTVLIVNVGAYLLALLLTKGLKGTSFFRAIFFMPNLIGGIVLGYIWNLLLNGFLVKYFDVNLTTNVSLGFWGLVILTCWQQIGYMMVIYIAAINGVPNEVLESAKIDGASRFTTTTKILLPMTLPSITICTFMTLTNGFKLYDQNLALNGRTAVDNQLLALDIYSTMFFNPKGNMGIGQAKAVLFFIFVALISFAQVSLSKKGETEA
jgi:raffinose/stachyose/melibiose transport system permease protein